MRMYDVILDKRNGGTLTEEQISYAISGFVSGEVPDYQMSALLMAIYFNGLGEQETARLTYDMSKSGDWIDLSPIPGVKVDKHSTGGVGDKTTLICGPIVAACGVPVAKMSGRGLGHTGGTVDKLEAIPGYNISLDKERFFEIVREVGISVIGQTGNIAPADKKIYALRDVTATVDSMPLIASSIMSKKLASGADAILLDVKTGSGALMKTLDDSIELARQMVAIGENMGRSMAALITDMDIPLGYAIGNSLEVAESAATLRGEGPKDLTYVSLELATNMLRLAGLGGAQACREKAESVIKDGSAFEKLVAMVRAQGGDASVIEDSSKFAQAPVRQMLTAEEDGYISHMDTEKIGTASVVLGAGREKKEDAIDYTAGIMILKKTGEQVQKGEPIAELYTSDKNKLEPAEALMRQAYVISGEAPAPGKLIHARVTKGGIERF